MKFSLRTLLVLVGAIAIWLGWEVSRARQKREALSTLYGEGPYAPLAVQHISPESGLAWMRSRVGSGMDPYPCDPTELDLFFSDMDDESLAHLKPFDQLSSLGVGRLRSLRFLPQLNSLRSLRFSESPIPDADMKYIVRCRNLRTLALGGSPITNAGVERLTELRYLEELTFRDCLVLTASSVQHLRRFPNLTSLTLSGQNITNAWLDEMSSLTNLEVVTIEGQNVTDDGVESLMGMKSLKRANFYETQVTQAVATRVQRTMNGCTIRVD